MLSYAIADLGAFVTPGDPVDVEAHTARPDALRRRQSKSRCTPRSISEGAASLLPDQVRPALLWTVRLDAEGSRTDVEVERARVRSPGPADLPGGAEAHRRRHRRRDRCMLLKEVGLLRLTREAARGGISLPLLEQEVDTSPGPVAASSSATCCRSRSWNAQMSLLTGFAAASLMIYARVGLLRTLPDPRPPRRPAAAPHRARARHRVAGRAALRRPHPRASTRPSRSTPR